MIGLVTDLHQRVVPALTIRATFKTIGKFSQQNPEFRLGSDKTLPKSSGKETVMDGADQTDQTSSAC